MKKKTIWIAWEKQRRTIELSKALNAKLFLILTDTCYMNRIFYSIYKTVLILLKEKPQILIVQNPSEVLALVAGFLKYIWGFKLIVDRHSNFAVCISYEKITFKSNFTNFLRNVLTVSVKMADITIVTNSFLEQHVKKLGGRGVVLPDTLPDMGSCYETGLTNKITFISTFSRDEPYLEMIKSAKYLPQNVLLNITGDYKKISPSIINDSPKNVKFTGYIPDKDYKKLLQDSDIILCFTTRKYTMLCGAYEAVSLEKPLITSNKEVLVDYFNKGVEYIEHDSKVISNTVRKIYSNYTEYKTGIKQLKYEIKGNWNKRFKILQESFN